MSFALGIGGGLSAALLSPDISARATFISREHGVVAGTRCAGESFNQVDASLVVSWRLDDGDRVEPGSVIGTVDGAIGPILSAERTALNFLGHLSGVATRVNRFVERAGPGIRVWDTRKTTPGLRALEKAAVRAGGGRNHRGNLSDWVMLKDNHLMGIGITAGVALAKDRRPGRTIHVEAERLAQVLAAATFSCVPRPLELGNLLGVLLAFSLQGFYRRVVLRTKRPKLTALG